MELCTTSSLGKEIPFFSKLILSLTLKFRLIFPLEENGIKVCVVVFGKLILRGSICTSLAWDIYILLVDDVFLKSWRWLEWFITFVDSCFFFHPYFGSI
jgi:hypothetical protein